MDIKITEKSLRKFLDTKADLETIIDKLCLCGPTVDRYHNVEGDTVLEIEAITNRIDTASSYGVAREANAILNQHQIPSTIKNDPYNTKIELYSNLPKRINIQVQDRETVIRFVAVEMENISVKESPPDVISFLDHSDQRGINNLVDITNEITINFGIPCHIFDRDKLSMSKLTVRLAKENEKITTLDGDTLNLTPEDTIIEDGSGRIVDLCGVMGGDLSKVDDHTKNILVIVPIYNTKLNRKTSLRHQKRTLAAQIYEKGPDPELCLSIAAEIIELIKVRAGGHVSSSVFDLYLNPLEEKTVSINLDWLKSFAGVDINSENCVSILSNLGFKKVLVTDKTLTATVPSFRYRDINIQEDLAEEIIRVYGYFSIPGTLPSLVTPPQSTDGIFNLERKISNSLRSQGFHEVLNNSLVSESTIINTLDNPNNHFKLTNPLSQDFEFLRTSLIPSAILNVKNNLGIKDYSLSFFEIGNVYLKKDGQELPEERPTLTITSSADILKLKQILEFVLREINVSKYTFAECSDANKIFNPLNLAQINVSNKPIGQIGEIKKSILNKFGISSTINTVEIDLSALQRSISPTINYQPISDYPEVVEDITLETNLTIGEAIEKINQSNELVKKVSFVSSFQNKLSFKIHLISYERNLTKEDSDLVRNQITNLFK